MFKLISEKYLKARDITAKLYRHDCGLEVLCLDCNDPENIFAVGFSTMAKNSTGCPHILEHSVLGGSKKYPVKDPFIELVKSSAAIFINAMTYSDHTLYPFVTCNHQDYFNLFDVYWDAVFHPNITKQTFMQEGWHYEIKKDKLIENGIVLNEMKGYYSSVGINVQRETVTRLLPKSPVSNDSGGYPSCISQLTYRQFMNFYRRHYNPGVARILVYGNIPSEKKLAYIEKHLTEEKFTCYPSEQTPTSGICIPPRQPRWKKAKNAQAQYNPENANDQTWIANITWLIDDTRTPLLNMTMLLLDSILSDNSSAPLRKAIMDSELGTSITELGYDDECLETIFNAGLRGIKNQKDAKKFIKLVDDTLKDVVAKGITEKARIAAFNQFKFDCLEIDSQNYMDIIDDVFSVWHYGCNPLIFLNNTETFAELSQKIQENPRYLEDVIQKYLIDNPHRLNLILEPNASLKQQKQAEDEKRLANILSNMTEMDKEKIVRENKKLEKVQKKANSAADLATLPKLKLSDINPDDIPEFIEKIQLSNGLPVYRGTINANGLTYLAVTINLAEIPSGLFQYLTGYTGLLSSVGTQDLTYDKLAEEAEYLGARFNYDLILNRSCKNPEKQYISLQFMLSVLEENLEPAMDLLMKNITSKIFTERKRITQILKMAYTRFKSKLSSSFSNTSIIRSQAILGLSDSLLYKAYYNYSGFNDFFALRNLAENLNDDKLNQYIEKLTDLGNWIGKSPISAVAFVGSDNAFKKVEKTLLAMPFSPYTWWSRDILPEIKMTSGRRDFFCNGDVSSCIRVSNMPQRNDSRTPSIKLFSKILSENYLWEEVRVKNGAYGTSAYVLGDFFCLQSSQDSKPEATYKIFDNWHSQIDVISGNKDLINTSIISMAGRLSTNIPKPSQVCNSAISQGLTERTSEDLRQDIANIMKLTPTQLLKDMKSYYEEFGAICNDCMIGPNMVPGFTEIKDNKSKK